MQHFLDSDCADNVIPFAVCPWNDGVKRRQINRDRGVLQLHRRINMAVQSVYVFNLIKAHGQAPTAGAMADAVRRAIMSSAVRRQIAANVSVVLAVPMVGIDPAPAR